jgi:HD-like signal output (HDOD) protein
MSSAKSREGMTAVRIQTLDLLRGRARLDLEAKRNRETRLLATLSVGLPTLPCHVFELDEMLRANPVNLDRISTLIARDPSLASQVLGLCNPAPGVGFPSVSGIRDAVAQLGPERLRTLMLTCSLIQSIAGDGMSEQVHAFWHHSTLTALLSQRIAMRTGYPVPEKAYLAGLLHDIGFLALLEAFSPRLSTTNDSSMDDSEDELIAEREAIGLDHCAAGVWLGFCWNFSPELTDVLEHHHEPEKASHDVQLVTVVAVADLYCRSRGITVGMENCPAIGWEILQTLSPWLAAGKRADLADDLENEIHHYMGSASFGQSMPAPLSL